MSLEPISLRLQGRHGWLRPGSYLVAVRAFWKLLQNLDITLSGEAKGSVDWEISACKRSGPAVVIFLGHLRKPPKDVVCEIRRTVFNGIRKLSTSDERPHGFTDTALQELRALAEQRGLMDEIAVIVDEKEELIQWSFIERIERMTHNDFEALSSVAGTLESVSGVVVFGNLKSNYLGEPMHMRVSGIEPCPNEQDLPNIPRMSGRIPVAAGTTPNRIYIPGAKYGK